MNLDFLVVFSVKVKCWRIFVFSYGRMMKIPANEMVFRLATAMIWAMMMVMVLDFVVKLGNKGMMAVMLTLESLGDEAIKDLSQMLYASEVWALTCSDVGMTEEMLI